MTENAATRINPSKATWPHTPKRRIPAKRLELIGPVNHRSRQH
jgi:hypothetical protein